MLIRLVFILDFIVVAWWYVTSIRLWMENSGEKTIHPIYILIAVIMVTLWVLFIIVKKAVIFLSVRALSQLHAAPHH